MRTTYTVTGMTCEHCAEAVAAEVGLVDGVTAVEVDLAGGELHVDGADYTDAAVHEAVEEAGYRVA